MFKRWRPLAFYGVSGTVVASVVSYLLLGEFHGQDEIDAVAGPVILAFDVTGAVFAFLASFRRGLEERTRRAWRWIGAASLVLAACSISFAVFGTHGFPAPGDIFRLSFTPVMLVGLLSLPRRGSGGLARWKLLMDVGTVVVAGAMVMWYFVLGPALAAHDLPGAAIAGAVAYPIGDVVLLFGVTLVLLQGVDAAVRRSMRLLAAALLFEMVGNVYLGYLRSHPVFESITTWQFSCWIIGHFLIASAAFEQSRASSRRRFVGGPEGAVSRMPYLSVLIGFVLLAVAAVRQGAAYPWLGLVAGCITLTAIVVVRQVFALRENHQLAVTDPLTGLANRARLRDALARALARSIRNGQPVAVLLADLNGFKEVNDTLGHAAGDRLLVEFAGMLRRSVLGSDVVGRLGGDEFAVVLSDIGSRENAEAVVRRLRQQMELPVMIGDVVVQMRSAVGIALTEPGESDGEAVIRRADEAMYADKRRIKNGPGPTSDQKQLATDLWGAAERGELRVYYQPVVELPSGAITGVEALVRWQHPAHGMIPPGAFVPLAERIGAIDEIGAWVLAEACAAIAGWRAAGRDLHLAVNASARQLNGGFADRVARVLAETGLPGAALIIEITESVQVDNADVVSELHRLHDLGVRVALDDFGTGYSTLRYLTQLPIDILKIDQSFVSVLNGTAQSAVVADTVLRLGRMMNLTTIAEGVESAEQATELAGLGCLNAQGYHFARPMPGEELESLLFPAVSQAG
ncbi:putative bifunctional diguanylate cyclase/phosphodiesterase [Actinoplanes ianthinogenes]|nr:bifunctional diguanylate cyclase/phosphodiesterase [Actinoplanes ianthinogenes]